MQNDNDKKKFISKSNRQFSSDIKTFPKIRIKMDEQGKNSSPMTDVNTKNN